MRVREIAIVLVIVIVTAILIVVVIIMESPAHGFVPDNPKIVLKGRMSSIILTTKSACTLNPKTAQNLQSLEYLQQKGRAKSTKSQGEGPEEG